VVGDGGLLIGAEKALGLLNDLTVALDDAAERRGVDKLSATSTTYVACCGMSRQRLDHASRTIDFAQDVLTIVRRLNRDRQAGMQVQIGIESGAAAGGVVGKKRFRYNLSGETVAAAAAIARQALDDTIRVGRQTFTSTQNLYRYGMPAQVGTPGSQPITAWPLLVAEDRELPPAQESGGTPDTPGTAASEDVAPDSQPQAARNV
jgi:class 3 adenylate cyclase